MKTQTGQANLEWFVPTGPLAYDQENYQSLRYVLNHRTKVVKGLWDFLFILKYLLSNYMMIFIDLFKKCNV